MVPEENRQEILKLIKEKEGTRGRVEQLRGRLKELGCSDELLELVKRFDEYELALQQSWGTNPNNSLCPSANDWRYMEGARALRAQVNQEFGLDLPRWDIGPNTPIR